MVMDQIRKKELRTNQIVDSAFYTQTFKMDEEGADRGDLRISKQKSSNMTVKDSPKVKVNLSERLKESLRQYRMDQKQES